jgi:hypothetical protein
MFSGEWVDNRTRTQKRRDKAREAPRQQLLFSQREIAQVGVNPRPRFSLSPQTQLRLLHPDFRSSAEVAQARERAAQQQNKRLWEETQTEQTMGEVENEEASEHPKETLVTPHLAHFPWSIWPLTCG